MVHISLGSFKFIQSVQSLSLGKRSQSCHCTDLSLSAGKHCRTVNSRDQIHFCCKRTDLCDLTSVRSFVIFEDHLADSLFLILINSLTQYVQPFFVICKFFLKSGCDLADIFFSCLLVVCEYSLFHFFRRNDLADCRKQLFRYCAGSVQMFFFAAVCNDLINKTDDLLVYLMSLVNCLDHLVFRNLVCSGFDHDDFFSCRGNSKLKIRNLLLSQRRVDHKFAVNKAYLSSSAGTVKRNVGNAGCNSRTEHCRNLRIAFRVNRHYHIYKCYVISVILWKQRTHGTVNNAGSKDRMLACLSFSFIKASRDLSYCIHFFLILNT